ncbi:MAG: hypothetical protein HY777_08725 [Betaproteobacteria bacterium]|nr:hypothetical protein [Betaproteobacteria bacterium]
MKTILHAVLLALALLGSAAANAEATLRSKEQLAIVLKSRLPCCVIDGRSEDKRREHPLNDALPYRAEMTINPTASVVVVADSDSAAMQIGKTLAAAHPGKSILAVKGGVAAWEAVLADLMANAPKSSALGGINFVIPHNTCETGTPLQQLRSAPGSSHK